jgi:hypothetical protein
MSQPLDIIIVERLGSLKMLSIKDFKEEELFKKCGFKKADGFNKQTEWFVKLNGNKYLIKVYAKVEGRGNSENKYDFPPPIDTKLFYGSCAIVAEYVQADTLKKYTNLSLALWNKIYEKLFGGFEDLVTTAKEVRFLKMLVQNYLKNHMIMMIKMLVNKLNFVFDNIIQSFYASFL